MELPPLLILETRVAQAGAQRFGHHQGPFLAGLREDDGKLVATDAGGEIALAQLPMQQFGQLLEDRVTAGMAVGVVDVLEIVQVEHEDGKLVAVPFRAFRLVDQDVVEVAPVVQPGQGIVHRVILQLRHGPVEGLGRTHHHDHYRQYRADDTGLLLAQFAVTAIGDTQQAGQVEGFELGHADGDEFDVLHRSALPDRGNDELLDIERHIIRQFELAQHASCEGGTGAGPHFFRILADVVQIEGQPVLLGERHEEKVEGKHRLEIRKNLLDERLPLGNLLVRQDDLLEHLALALQQILLHQRAGKLADSAVETEEHLAQILLAGPPLALTLAEEQIQGHVQPGMTGDRLFHAIS